MNETGKKTHLKIYISLLEKQENYQNCLSFSTAQLDAPDVFVYPSTDGRTKVVITFTSEYDKPYDTILGTTTDIYDVEVIEDCS